MRLERRNAPPASLILLSIGLVVGLMALSGSALIYAAGIDGLMAGNVPQNQMAKSLGISRARLNYYVGEWRDTLKYTVLKFCRSDATRAIYAARQTKIHAEKNPKSQCKTH